MHLARVLPGVVSEAFYRRQTTCRQVRAERRPDIPQIRNQRIHHALVFMITLVNRVEFRAYLGLSGFALIAHSLIMNISQILVPVLKIILALLAGSRRGFFRAIGGSNQIIERGIKTLKLRSDIRSWLVYQIIQRPQGTINCTTLRVDLKRRSLQAAAGCVRLLVAGRGTSTQAPKRYRKN